MTTIKIKNVDIPTLHSQIRSVSNLMEAMPILNTNSALVSIMTILKTWSNEQYQDSLGSTENQKAKERQLNIQWEKYD